MPISRISDPFFISESGWAGTARAARLFGNLRSHPTLAGYPGRPMFHVKQLQYAGPM